MQDNYFFLKPSLQIVLLFPSDYYTFSDIGLLNVTSCYPYTMNIDYLYIVIFTVCIFVRRCILILSSLNKQDSRSSRHVVPTLSHLHLLLCLMTVLYCFSCIMSVVYGIKCVCLHPQTMLAHISIIMVIKVLYFII